MFFRVYHNSVVRCQVQNPMGTAEDSSVIQIKCKYHTHSLSLNMNVDEFLVKI